MLDSRLVISVMMRLPRPASRPLFEDTPLLPGEQFWVRTVANRPQHGIASPGIAHQRPQTRSGCGPRIAKASIILPREPYSGRMLMPNGNVPWIAIPGYPGDVCTLDQGSLKGS